MIPKIVHYCWFGNTPKNYLANRCVKSFNKLGGGGGGKKVGVEWKNRGGGKNNIYSEDNTI